MKVLNPRGTRCYPRSRVAAFIVWLLDRLPERIRRDVLGAYWSHADLAQMKERANTLRRLA